VFRAIGKPADGFPEQAQEIHSEIRTRTSRKCEPSKGGSPVDRLLIAEKREELEGGAWLDQVSSASQRETTDIESLATRGLVRRAASSANFKPSARSTPSSTLEAGAADLP
jgi:hypothetical protein